MLRIAVISDIHFGRDATDREYVIPKDIPNGDVSGGASRTESIEKVLQENKVDYVFIAGDLTSVGDPLEFYLCEGKINDIVTHAGISMDRVVWCLGNHDFDRDIYKLYDKYNKFSKSLKTIGKNSYKKIASSVAIQYMHTINNPLMHSSGIDIPATGIVDNDDFVVFVINSSFQCSGEQEYDHGKLTRDQLQWTIESFKKYKDDSRWKIVLLHHHPIDYAYPMPTADISKIEENAEFVESAGHNGINVIIHGHRHHPRAETMMNNGWMNPITFISAGSFSVGPEQRAEGQIPNTFSIIELSDVVGEIKLSTYEFSNITGWQLIKGASSYVPLDSEMYLGKVYDDNERMSKIKELVQNSNEDTITIYQRNLPDELKYCTVALIEDTFRKALGDKYDVDFTTNLKMFVLKKK